MSKTMKRLTNRLPDGTAYVVSETGEEGVGCFTTQRRLPEVIARLAAYEDTGLTPEEINVLTPSAYRNANTCVCCGAIIPEGRQVCPTCENGVRA